jgi:hypothetical protein
MDGGGLDGRRARHLFCRSLRFYRPGISKSRTFARIVRGITDLRADSHGSALFLRRQPSPDRRLRRVLNTTYLRAFYIFFMPRLLEW